MDQDHPDTTVARRFVAARAQGRALPTYPGDLPQTLAKAYAIQDAAIALTGVPVGWKVGRIAPPREGQERLAGPIFAPRVRDDGSAMPVIANGFAAAEAEFLLRIGTTTDPAKRAWTMDEATAQVDAVHVGIEIAGSPFPEINAHGAAVTISDFGNNNGLVVGPAVAGWRDADIRRWPVTMTINGEQVGASTAEAMLDGPFGAVRFLLEHLAARGIAVPAGTWVSTGAVTGIHRVAPGDRVEARFGDALTVACSIVAAGTEAE